MSLKCFVNIYFFLKKVEIDEITNYFFSVFVVLSFFICWAPYHCQRLLTVSMTEQRSLFMMRILEYLYYISGVSIYISSTINPILYNLMSERYRVAFKNTLKMLLTCKMKSQQRSAYTQSAYHLSRMQDLRDKTLQLKS
jgi:hypothetical protein